MRVAGAGTPLKVLSLQNMKHVRVGDDVLLQNRLPQGVQVYPKATVFEGAGVVWPRQLELGVNVELVNDPL